MLFSPRQIRWALVLGSAAMVDAAALLVFYLTKHELSGHVGLIFLLVVLGYSAFFVLFPKAPMSFWPEVEVYHQLQKRDRSQGSPPRGHDDP